MISAMKAILTILGINGIYAGVGENLHFEWPQSLYAPYVDFDGRNSNWDFDALISRNDFVQLTPDLPGKVGWAFSKEVLEAKDWRVDFFFRISGKHPADGLAFWFTEERFVPGQAFGYKENFKGLGVFFDTFNNKRYESSPTISAMVGDGTKTYDHDTDGEQDSIGNCLANVANTDAPVHARITYHNRQLMVSFQKGDGEWHHCFRAKNVRLPKRGFIGFTARTGALSAKHDLYAVSTAIIAPDVMRPLLSYGDNKRVSPWVRFIQLVGISGIIGVTYYLYINNRRKNF